MNALASASDVFTTGIVLAATTGAAASSITGVGSDLLGCTTLTGRVIVLTLRQVPELQRVLDSDY